MAELKKDPKVIASARKHLVTGERVLWAARHPVIGRRSLLHFSAQISALFTVAGIMALFASGSFNGYLRFLAFIAIIWSPHLVFGTLEMIFRQFLVTDRRVIFVSAFWPFRSSYWNHSELDAHWIRHGKDRNVIHLKPFVRGVPSFTWRHAVYPNHIENIPDIEAVRETILAQIAISPAPVETRSSPRPPMPGTRTG
jgi:hypothetical protein